MSGGIEEPYTIAQLPRPIENGSIVASPVCSFSGSRKRKRHEVAVGVDGEGINIYNVQDQSTVTSYPLPPQSYLAAPPCSVFCKRAKPLRSERQTYVALRDGFRQSKLRLVSFTEEQGKVRKDLKEPRLPVKREHQLRHGELAGLDILPFGDETPNQQSGHTVLVSYKNGNVECLTNHLLAQRWHKDLSLVEGNEVEYATVLDFDTARKGLLKNREDVLALLDVSDNAASNGLAPPLLFQVLRSGSQRSIRIHALRDVTGDSLQTPRSTVEELLSYELVYRHGSSHTAAYELHSGSGVLYQRLDHRLTVFDLTSVVPKISFELGKKGVPRVHSFARLSSATLIAISDEKIAVFDTKYGSVLSFLELSQKRRSDDAHSSLSIVSQFTDLGIIVGLSQTNLVALQVGDILDDGRHAKVQGPLLVDVMGKSKFTDPHEVEHLSKKKEQKRQKWEAWKTEVDQAVEQRAVDKVEELVAKDLRLPANEIYPTSQPDGLTNGDSTLHVPDLWKLPPKAYDAQHIETKKTIYLVGKLFTWVPPRSALGGNCKLQLVLVSRNVLRWLALAGYLTPSEIEHALPKSVPGVDARPRVAPGDIIAAIHDAEPTFTLLYDLVSLPMQWEIPEVVTGLQRLIWSLQDRDRIDEDVEMANGEADEDRIMSEAAKATEQLEIANRLLESGLVERSQACKILLARLQVFPQKDVAMTMHQILAYEELLFLISILRVELFDGNWAMRYIEGDVDDDVNPGDLGAAQEIRLSNQAIRSISRLFSCAIDAVGMSGWLVGLSADTIGAHEVIQSLRAEIMAATEGLYNASYIEVLIGEVGKTAGSLEERKKEQDQIGWRKRKRDEEEANAEELSLPLGGRIRPPRPAKGGRHVKPAILAEERSRNVGKYSFERIRI